MPSFLAYVDISGDFTSEVDFNLHVHKRVERFVYSSNVLDSAVPISYIETPEPDPRQLIAINHGLTVREFYGLEQGSNAVSTFTGTVYTAATQEISATNVFITDKHGHREPLWFKHKLSSGVQSVTVRKVQQGEVPEYTGIYIDLEGLAVYTNYRNYFNPETGAWLIYFIDQVLEDGVVSSIYSPVPAVSLGVSDDIDITTGLYPPNLAVYDRSVSGIGWEFSFNIHDTYWVREAPGSSLTVKLPTQWATNDSWFLEVSNGDFRRDGSRYRVSEWGVQPFSPSAPYLTALGRKLRFVNTSVLSTGVRGLTVDTASGLHLEISCYKEDRTLVEIYTTDTSKTGADLNGVPYLIFDDVSVDADTGLISIGFSALPGWEYIGNYTYVAHDFLLKSLDVNPILNSKLIDGSYIIYVWPDVIDGENSIHWMYVKGGKILETSQGPGAASYLNLQMTDGVGTYNNYSVIGRDISDFLSQAVSLKVRILATVGLKNIPGLWDIFDVDVRRVGPQLVSPEEFKHNPKNLYTDLGYGLSGESIPGAGAIIIDVPIDILEGYGGHISEETVREHLERYLPATVYAVINYTYPAPALLVENTTTSLIDITAPYVGGTEYKLLRRATPTLPWVELDTNTPTLGADSVFQDTVTPGELWWYAVGVDDYPVKNAVRIEVM